MMDLTARPEPLRVPVGEVVARTSLVTPLPPTIEPPTTLAVVQRAVRIISDPPPAPPTMAAATLIDDLKLGGEEIDLRFGDDLAALQGGLEAADSREIDAAIDSVLPGPNEEGGFEAPLSPPLASIADAIDAALADASSLRDQPSDAPYEAPAPSEPPPLDDLSQLQTPPMAVHVPSEALRPQYGAPQTHEEAAGHARSGGVELAGLAAPEFDPREVASPELDSAPPPPEEGEFSAAFPTSSEVSIDIDLTVDEAPAATRPSGPEGPSLPPPAPPQALRRSAPNDTPPASVREEPALEARRPSGEFEELDVEAVAEVRAAQESRAASRPGAPPPPPPMRNIAEPEVAPVRPARAEDVRPTRPRTQQWWELFFDDDYLRTVRPPSRQQVGRQVDFIEKRLGLKPGASVLDVGCGLGLQVLELNARGYVGVGLDLSLPMLTRASEEAQARAVRVNFLHGDMREMVFDAAFDAVLCLGTTFGYFDDDGNRKVLDRLHRALKPGGALLIDVVNRDHVVAAQPNLVWFEGDGCVCMEETELNFFTSRLHVKRTVIHDTGKQSENEYGMRVYSLHELGQLLNAAGFRVVEVSGRETVPAVFFGQESPNLIIVAQRRMAPEAAPTPTE